MKLLDLKASDLQEQLADVIEKQKEKIEFTSNRFRSEKRVVLTGPTWRVTTSYPNKNRVVENDICFYGLSGVKYTCSCGQFYYYHSCIHIDLLLAVEQHFVLSSVNPVVIKGLPGLEFSIRKSSPANVKLPPVEVFFENGILGIRNDLPLASWDIDHADKRYILSLFPVKGTIDLTMKSLSATGQIATEMLECSCFPFKQHKRCRHVMRTLERNKYIWRWDQPGVPLSS